MHEIGRELDDIAEAGALRGERGADIGEGEAALRIEVACRLAVPVAPTWPAMNKNSDALTRVSCEYCPSGLPRLSGLRIWMLGMSALRIDMAGP